MKTTAEEKLLRSLEKLVEDAAKQMTRAKFKETQADAHQTAMGVIQSHRRMIELWTAMDNRMQARARKVLAKKGTS